MNTEIPRRIRLDLMTPAELAIREAVLAVEAVGADPRLTDAVVLLQRARDLVADVVDEHALERMAANRTASLSRAGWHDEGAS